METTISSPEENASDGATLSNAHVAEQLVAVADRRVRRVLLSSLLPRVDVDQFLPFLKAEAERTFSISGYTSLRYAETLIDAADVANRPGHRALGLLSSADAYRILGQFAESLAQYEEARATFAALSDEVGWARTYIGWIHAANMVGRGEEALDAVAAAYDVFTRYNERLLGARLDQNTAVVHILLGHFDKALYYYDRAQRVAESLGEVGDGIATRAKTNKADIYTLLGDFDTALALHMEARAAYQRRGAIRLILRQDLSIADLALSQGDYTQSLRWHTDALAALEREGVDTDAAEAQFRLAACYLSLNQNREALTLAEASVARFDNLGSPLLAAKARVACALAHARLGNNQQSQELLKTAAGTFAAGNFTADVGLVTLQRAQLYLGDGDWARALEEAEQAHALFADRGLIVRQTQADIARAHAMIALGRSDEAERIARTALAVVSAHNLLWLAPQCHHILATVARERGDIPAALEACRHAIDAIDRVQGRVAIELRGSFLEDKQQVFHDAIDCCIVLSDMEQAFHLLERAKSRALVEYLTTNPEVRIATAPHDEAERDLVEELRRLREEHNWLYNRLYGYAITRQAGDREEEIGATALQAAIRDREQRIERLLERLAVRRSENAEQIGQRSRFSDARRSMLPALDADTILLEYYLHERGGAVFVIADQRLTVVHLAASAGDVRRLVDRWQVNLQTTARAVAAGQPLTALARNARGCLEALWRVLIAPVAHLLNAHSATRLVVVPYGTTHAVPFHALHDGAHYLLESTEVSVCPSSDVLRLCAMRARHEDSDRRALILAHSDGGRLPFVRHEARLVADLFPGERYEEDAATRAVLTEAVPRHRIVHIAAHGEARLDNPTFAYLQLADGQLSTTDVFNLDLHGAIVTLSGCETGRSMVTGGDELMGLSRGFLFAGAATLVQSLWRVEDGTTARLMEHFYTHLRVGNEPGAALRAAQRALLAASDTGVHPFFWAPFQLVGASR